MRIIAGKHKSRRLNSLNRRDVRPTTDRTKESVFNIIGPNILGSRFLDLYAGFGGIGIEAISRGAKEVTFIEKDRRNAEVINDNLAMISESAQVLVNDVLRGLTTLRGKFDLIYLDPPYQDINLYTRTLELIKDNSLLSENGIVIVENFYKDDLNISEGYEIIREKRYGKAGINLLRVVREGEEANE